MERTAKCSCGQLSITVDGNPEFHGMCSCLACQRMTGSAFDYSGYWPKSAVKKISGEHQSWRRETDSNRWFEQNFCLRCGSTVFNYGEWAPDKINIMIGAFADPNFPRPGYAVWTKYQHAWFDVPAWCPSMEEQESSSSD